MFTKNFGCMGTTFIFQIADTDDDAKAKEAVKVACSILEDADNTFSLYKPESEVSLLNSGKLDWEDASKTQVDVKQQVTNWTSITEGYFNPVSPEGVYDPSGLVKTWATRNAAIYLEANGYRDFTINAGGDIYLGPQVSTAPLTRVGLSNLKPIASKDAAVNMVLDLKGTDFRAVATSGSAERGEHIWASKSTSQPREFIQVSVAALDILTADIWATALIAGGLEALDVFESKVDPTVAVAMVTTSNGKIISTPGFSQILADLK